MAHFSVVVKRQTVSDTRRAERHVQRRVGHRVFCGKHVNLAARIAAQADAGQILVSSLLKELTDTGGDIEFDGGKEVELKGLTGTQRVFVISW